MPTYKKTRVDLALFSAEHRGAVPLECQRRAGLWLAALRKAAGSSGALPVELASARIDVLDVLRSPLIIRGAYALDRLHLARALAERYPAKRVVLLKDEGPCSVRDLVRLVSPAPQRPRVSREFRPVARAVAGAREFAYRVKMDLKRLAARANDTAGPGRWGVIAVPRVEGHLADLLPVAQSLRSDHGIETLFAVPGTRMHGRIAGEGFDVTDLDVAEPFNRRVPGSTLSRWRRALSAAAGSLSEGDAGDLTRDELRALSLSLTPVLTEYLRPVARLAVAVDRLMRRCRPGAVLVGNPYTFEGRLAALIASQLGTKTATIEHGSIVPEASVWDDCPLDLVCAWGPASRRALLACGVADHTIQCTGVPRLDAILAGLWARRDQAVGRERPYILVATSGPGGMVSPEQHSAFISLLYRVASALPHVHFIIKLHPKDSEEHYRDASRQHQTCSMELVRGRMDAKGLDIYEFLVPARALVTIGSTATLDAMVMGVPVVRVCIDDTDTYGKMEFLSDRFTTPVRGVDEFVATIGQLWAGESQHTSRLVADARSEFYSHLGESSSRAAGHIAALCQSST